MNKSSVQKTGLRNDITALRAIAIVSVLFFHFKVPILQGGFAGVDIFFVISGYLMSRIIIGSVNEGVFSYKQYFEKRLVRIAPALIFLVFTLMLICFFLYFPEEFKRSQKSAAASLLFISNILYWQNSGYFAPESETNIFLHTWSLSVEWQFYLCYPFLLILSSKIFKEKKSKAYILFFAGSIILIFLTTVFFTESNPNASFYFLVTRSWEMLFGGIAYLSEDFIKGLSWRKPTAVFGYILIAGSMLLLKSTLPWPGFYTALPVIGTFMVIIANVNSFTAINHSSIQFLGKISYSLYLWHWPVYVIAQYCGADTNFLTIILFTIISVGLGYLSYNYIESGILFLKSKTIMVSMAALTVLTGLLSLYGVNKVLFEKKTLAIASFDRTHKKEHDRQFMKGICHVNNLENYNRDLCLCIKKNKVNILLIGDSHLAQLSQSFREKFFKSNVNFLQATASNTWPTIKNYQQDKVLVREMMDFIYYDFIPRNAPKIDAVIISGHWAGKGVSNKTVLYGINETIHYLKKYNINTIVIGQTEAYKIPYATIAAKDYEYSTKTAHLYDEEDAYQLDNYLEKHLGPSYVRVINPERSYPGLSSKGEPYMNDEHHVTKYGADLLLHKVLADPSTKDFLILEGIDHSQIRKKAYNRNLKL